MVSIGELSEHANMMPGSTIMVLPGFTGQNRGLNMSDAWLADPVHAVTALAESSSAFLHSQRGTA